MHVACLVCVMFDVLTVLLERLVFSPDVVHVFDVLTVCVVFAFQ